MPADDADMDMDDADAAAMRDPYNRKDITETGAKRTGASKGDKGKDKDDPEAKDYTDGGDRKGDESKTHKGEKDYTTKKGDKLKHSGKGRGEKKGDEAYVNEADDAEITEEEDAIDEMAAKRQGNEDRDVGRDRMHSDRMHEDADATKPAMTKEDIREALRRVLSTISK